MNKNNHLLQTREEGTLYMESDPLSTLSHYNAHSLFRILGSGENS